MSLENEMSNNFVDKWRIIQMDKWNKEYINLIGPGFILFGKDKYGSLRFGNIDADIDYRILEEYGPMCLIGFSFRADHKGSVISGRGELSINDKKSEGIIYIHRGDESEFICEPFKSND